MLILTQELLVLLILLASGVCIGLIYDVIKIIRTPLKNKFFVSFLDLVLISACGIILIYVLYITSSSKFRIQNLFLIGVGMVAYFIGPSKLILRLRKYFVQLIGKLRKSNMFKYLTK